MLSISLPSTADTETLGALVAAQLAHGDVVALIGEVGAGKTTFVRGAAVALGCLDPVRSPTYTVGHVYEAAGGRSAAHLDLYRSDELDESAWGDVEPLFDSQWVFIEWPGAGNRWLAEKLTWTIELSYAGEHRLARIRCHDSARQKVAAHEILGQLSGVSGSV